MAEQSHKSHAEKAVSAAKAKKTKKKAKKVSVNNSALKKMSSGKQEKKERVIPLRLISSLVFLGLFVLFLVTFLLPEGFVIAFLSNFVQGLIGRTGFIVAIPILLYLFINELNTFPQLFLRIKSVLSSL